MIRKRRVFVSKGILHITSGMKYIFLGEEKTNNAQRQIYFICSASKHFYTFKLQTEFMMLHYITYLHENVSAFL